MSSAQPHFNKGDKVEVLKRDEFSIWCPAAVLRPSVSKKHGTRLYVEFETLCSDADPKKRPKEYVRLADVRPAPPPDQYSYFRAGDSVDVWYGNKGWRRGIVEEISEDSMYIVALGDGDEEIESVKVEQWQLRVPRNWKDGSWLPPQNPQHQSKTEDCLITPRGVKIRIKCTRRSCVRKFSKKMLIEVNRGKQGFERSWYAAVMMEVLGNGKFFVQYQTLKTDNGTDLLIEEVDASCIRPFPPEIEMINSFEHLDKVDVWFSNGWWEGHVSEVLDGAKYTVCFSSTNEFLTFEHSNLRPHQEWINNKWVPATKCDLPRSSNDGGTIKLKVGKVKIKSDRKALSSMFSKGMMVEATSFEEGYHGSWYTAVIFDSIGQNKFLLEYQTLRTDDESELLKEKADGFNLRPCPPVVQRFDRFKMFEEVDAWYNDGWWEGLISRVLSGLKYIVYFWTTNEEIEFDHFGMRPHQEWVDGKWDIAFKKSNILPNPKLRIMKRHSGEFALGTSFCIGAKVEIKDDEEGNQGCWYPALILRPLGNEKYLVEFRTIKCDHGMELLVEEVDGQCIRPSPPILQRADEFRALEEVDAWFNNGWQVGEVSDVLEGAKYRVYFGTTNEILEFRHHGLRPHQDWINGTWVGARRVWF